MLKLKKKSKSIVMIIYFYLEQVLKILIWGPFLLKENNFPFIWSTVISSSANDRGMGEVMSSAVRTIKAIITSW